MLDANRGLESARNDFVLRHCRETIVNLVKQVGLSYGWLDFSSLHARVKGGSNDTHSSILIQQTTKWVRSNGFVLPAWVVLA